MIQIHQSNLCYFSVQSDLAQWLTVNYFNGEFVVDVTDSFNPLTNPGSSNPAVIHFGFAQAAMSDDWGDPKIQSIKDTLRYVTTSKHLNGEIDKAKHDEVLEIIDMAAPRDFRPLIYVIPQAKIDSTRRKDVPIRSKPNFKSREWRILDLRQDEFEIIVTRLATDL